MLDAANHFTPDNFIPRSIDVLQQKLTTIGQRQPQIEPGMGTEVVCAALTTMSHDLTVREASLLPKVEELGRAITSAKSAIAALQVDGVTGRDIPLAIDELNAIVDHSAYAILESCEMPEANFE
jgi:hypothetical protein